jgi:hypothetical protein
MPLKPLPPIRHGNPAGRARGVACARGGAIPIAEVANRNADMLIAAIEASPFGIMGS